MYRFLTKKLFSTQKQGKLYIWKQSVNATSEVASNVIKAAVGSNHYAFITANNQLYTSYISGGKKFFEALGHNTKEGAKTPKPVDFFTKNNLKVVDVSVGSRHTLALTDNGTLWSFGVGNKKLNIIVSLFKSPMGALGHSDKSSHSLPKAIATFKDLPKITQIASGRIFNTAVDVNNDVYNWGLGELSVFGDGSNSNYQTPHLNEHFKYLKQSENLTIKKIQSASNCSMALMSDGCLYGWGSNDTGLLAINQTGGQMYQTYFYPTKIFSQQLGDRKIVDFEISDTSLIFEMQNGDIYWSGNKTAFKPEKLVLPTTQKVDKIGACGAAVVAVVGDKIYTRFNFVQKITHGSISEDVDTGVKQIPLNVLFPGATRIEQMGGSYRLNYAIVN